MSQPTINTTVRLDPAIRDRVQSLAEARQRSPHALMVTAIESYLDREEKRESLRQAGITAWEEYRRTGLHLTGAEVRGWIDQIRQGKKVPMPKCHL
jgi:predicted transcriptional regulator